MNTSTTDIGYILLTNNNKPSRGGSPAESEANMYDIKFCVARVRVDYKGTASVFYYACRPDMYGHHLTSDINDINVVWHDSIDEANRAMNVWANHNECIIARRIEHIPKFSKGGEQIGSAEIV